MFRLVMTLCLYFIEVKGVEGGGCGCGCGDGRAVLCSPWEFRKMASCGGFVEVLDSNCVKSGERG